MSFLAASKASKFFTALFSAVGLKADELQTAGESAALKIATETFSKKAIEQYEGTLEEAEQKIESLTNDLTAAKASIGSKDAEVTSLKASLASKDAELTAEKDARKADEAAHKLSVAKEAAALLAKSGHQPIAEIPVNDPKVKAKIDPTLTGVARTRAAFQAAIDARTSGRN